MVKIYFDYQHTSCFIRIPLFVLKICAYIGTENDKQMEVREVSRERDIKVKKKIKKRRQELVNLTRNVKREIQ